MTPTTPPPDPDLWGQRIVRRFMRYGGFRDLGRMDLAHRLFQRLLDRGDGDIELLPWDRRCNALAVWSLICIELGAAKESLDGLVAAIAVAQQKLENHSHPIWLGQLAFDLLLHHNSGMASADPEIRSDLLATLQQATAASLDQGPPNDPPIPPDLWLTDSVADALLDGQGTLVAGQLTETRKLLQRLGASGSNEALCFLVILGMGEPRHRIQWIEQAAQGTWPTSQLAMLLQGLLEAEFENHNRPRYRKSPNTFAKVNFPADDDPYYQFLSSLALKAAARSDWRKKAFIWRYSQYVAATARQEVSVDPWRKGAEAVSDQLEQAQFAKVRALEIADRHDFYDQKEIANAFESVSSQTAKLIEVFLKWSLITWPVDEATTRSLTNGYQETFKCRTIEQDYDLFVGRSLGAGTNKLTLVELLHSAGLLTQGAVDVTRLFVKTKGTIKSVTTANDIMDAQAKIPELLVANAMATKICPDHVFAKAPNELILEAVGAFNGAYTFRSQRNVAHYSRHTGDRNESIYWMNAVCSAIARLMHHR